MLFSRKIAPCCSYCLLGSSIGNGEIACVRRGITLEGSSCKRFVYDPIKREPERRRPPEKKPLEALDGEDPVI
jgi:hypothetical protein